LSFNGVLFLSDKSNQISYKSTIRYSATISNIEQPSKLPIIASLCVRVTLANRQSYHWARIVENLRGSLHIWMALIGTTTVSWRLLLHVSDKGALSHT
jgi:hypothetical protein